jgi:hypothetical protein
MLISCLYHSIPPGLFLALVGCLFLSDSVAAVHGHDDRPGRDRLFILRPGCGPGLAVWRVLRGLGRRVGPGKGQDRRGTDLGVSGNSVCGRVLWRDPTLARVGEKRIFWCRCNTCEMGIILVCFCPNRVIIEGAVGV